MDNDCKSNPKARHSDDAARITEGGEEEMVDRVNRYRQIVE